MSLDGTLFYRIMTPSIPPRGEAVCDNKICFFRFYGVSNYNQLGSFLCKSLFLRRFYFRIIIDYTTFAPIF